MPLIQQEQSMVIGESRTGLIRLPSRDRDGGSGKLLFPCKMATFRKHSGGVTMETWRERLCKKGSGFSQLCLGEMEKALCIAGGKFSNFCK